MLLAALLLAAAPTATPRPVVQPTPHTISRPEQSGLAGAAKGRKLNRSVSFEQGSVPEVTPVPRGTPKAGASPIPTLEPSDVIADEKRWRDRKAKLEAAVAKAQKEYDEASALNTVSTTGDPNSPEYQAMLAARNAGLTPYRMKLDDATRELRALPEECRRTPGCQPGWIR